jgi:hypothetical protein
METANLTAILFGNIDQLVNVRKFFRKFQLLIDLYDREVREVLDILPDTYDPIA